MRVCVWHCVSGARSPASCRTLAVCGVVHTYSVADCTCHVWHSEPRHPRQFRPSTASCRTLAAVSYVHAMYVFRSCFTNDSCCCVACCPAWWAGRVRSVLHVLTSDTSQGGWVPGKPSVMQNKHVLTCVPTQRQGSLVTASLAGSHVRRLSCRLYTHSIRV